MNNFSFFLRVFSAVDWMKSNSESKRNSISTLALAIVSIILGGFVGIAKVTNVAIMCILCVCVCAAHAFHRAPVFIVHRKYIFENVLVLSFASLLCRICYRIFHAFYPHLINISMAANARKPSPAHKIHSHTHAKSNNMMCSVRSAHSFTIHKS